jgi:hypothetical protein
MSCVPFPARARVPSRRRLHRATLSSPNSRPPPQRIGPIRPIRQTTPAAPAPGSRRRSASSKQLHPIPPESSTIARNLDRVGRQPPATKLGVRWCDPGAPGFSHPSLRESLPATALARSLVSLSSIRARPASCALLRNGWDQHPGRFNGWRQPQRPREVYQPRRSGRI